MDFKKLLEAMDKFAGEEVGQKPGDQVRGTEKAKPNKGKHPFLKRLVGELKQPKSTHKYEQELAEAWLEFKEAAPVVPGQPAAAPGATPTTPPGAAAKPAAPTTPVKPGQPDPKLLAAMQKNAANLKQVAPGANPQQLAKMAASIQTGAAPTATDKNALAAGLADPIADIMQNPQTANKFKDIVKQASTLDAAADKAAATTTAPGTQPK